MRVANDLLFSAQAVGSQAVNSEAFSVEHMLVAEVTIDVTGTGIDGAVKLQKNSEPAGSSAKWDDIEDSSESFEAAGRKTISLVDMGFRELRASATFGTGTATVTVRVNAKGA